MELGDSVCIPEEIITEILLRLPVKPLFRNKCISKQWNSIISDPNFRVSYMNRTSKPKQCLQGYLPQMIGFETSIDEHAPLLYLPILHYSTKKPSVHDVYASSNGLVLYGGNTPTIKDDSSLVFMQRLYVCNPLTKQSIVLPLIHFAPRKKICLSTRTDNSYQVLAIQRKRINGIDLQSCDIRIYSSDTQRWSDDEREVKSCPDVVSCSSPSTCGEGILHWFDFKERTMVTYDPYNSPDRFGCFDLPSVGPRDKLNLDYVLTVIPILRPNEVRFGEIEDRGGGERRLTVWRLYDKAKGEFCIDKTCRFSPSCELSDPFWHIRVFFCFLGVDDTIHGVCPRLLGSIVPFTLCPWASPSPCGGGGEDKESSPVKFIKVSPYWSSASN